MVVEGGRDGEDELRRLDEREGVVGDDEDDESGEELVL